MNSHQRRAHRRYNAGARNWRIRNVTRTHYKNEWGYYSSEGEDAFTPNSISSVLAAIGIFVGVLGALYLAGMMVATILVVAVKAVVYLVQ